MAEHRHPLEHILGHRFADQALLIQALTHRGALGVTRKGDEPPSEVAGNERLEFLGDRVLGLVIADTLFRIFPGENEGALASRLAALASAPTLAQVAEKFGLADYVKVAKGQRIASHETAVLADACEAVIGALFLDGGLPAAERLITTYWTPLAHASIAPPKDAKTALQEWAQGRGLPLPSYRVIESSGPAHAPAFKVTVAVQGLEEKQGRGRTKRLAEQAAATALLETLPEKSS